MKRIKHFMMSCAFWITIIAYVALILLSLCLMGFEVYAVFFLGSVKLIGVLQFMIIELMLLLCAALLTAKVYSLIIEEQRIKREKNYDRQSSIYE